MLHPECDLSGVAAGFVRERRQFAKHLQTASIGEIALKEIVTIFRITAAVAGIRYFSGCAFVFAGYRTKKRIRVVLVEGSLVITVLFFCRLQRR